MRPLPSLVIGIFIFAAAPAQALRAEAATKVSRQGSGGSTIRAVNSKSDDDATGGRLAFLVCVAAAGVAWGRRLSANARASRERPETD